jgi:hypothetical protein
LGLFVEVPCSDVALKIAVNLGNQLPLAFWLHFCQTEKLVDPSRMHGFVKNLHDTHHGQQFAANGSGPFEVHQRASFHALPQTFHADESHVRYYQ